MFQEVIILIYLVSYLSSSGTSEAATQKKPTFLISEGRDVVWGEAFYQAAIRIKMDTKHVGEINCAGVLVDYNMVLTAAQCVYFIK